jgi:ribonucleotide monophosphatase NagD (HAD superfamily)
MILTGKPSLHALRFVARRLGLPMTKIAVIGDDPAVEIIMARRGGATSFAVTTGFTKADDWAAQPANRRPHRLLTGVGDLLKLKELTAAFAA